MKLKKLKETVIKHYYFTKIFPLFHLLVDYSRFPPSVAILTHNQYIQLRLDAILLASRSLPIQEFLKTTLTIALENTFITFGVPNKEVFIQFWTRDKELEFDFPVKKTNQNGKYYNQLVLLLKNIGIKEVVSKGKITNIYWIEKMGQSRNIKANFGTNTTLTAEFILTIFDTIFDYRIDPYHISLA